MKRPFAAYTGDEPYAFVCYAHEDSNAVYPQIQRLHESGIRIWYDEGISPGMRWSDELARALGKASLVLFFCTPRSVHSQPCQDEVNFALDDKRPLLVVQDGQVDLPPGLRLRLGGHQSILKQELSAEQYADKLITAINRHLTAEPRVPNPRSLSRATRISRKKRVVVGGVAIVSILLAYFAVDRYWLPKRVAIEQPTAEVTPTVAPAATVISEKSIAVLPFTDMSEKHDQEYLADGMAEEILNLLAQVPDLLVSARTSSFYFKGKPTKIPDIARELGVVHVLEGSIRRSGDHLRVTAQLVRADNGYQLWSETYDRELSDVFKLQDDIANAVVQALQVKLMGGELSRRKGGTQNLDAYQLLLRARSAQAQYNQSSLDAAGEYLDQAIKLDPSYGGAWALLASNAVSKTLVGMLDPTEGVDRARQLAQHALQLSPDLSEAHSSLVLAFMLNWDWAAAEREVQRALAIDPANPRALRAAGSLSLTLGRWDDAERQYRAALARDPLNPFTSGGLGAVYYVTGRYAEAEAMDRKVLELAPGIAWYRQATGAALLLQGKAEAALAMVQQDVNEESRLELLPIMLQANGRKAEADEALRALIARWADRQAFYVAMNYAYRGDHDLALQWLERAYQQKDPYFKNIVGEPLFKNLADDPRYKAFLRKMKLPEDGGFIATPHS